MKTSDKIIVGRKYCHQKTGKIVKVLSCESWDRVRLEHASGRITIQQGHYFKGDYNLLPITSKDGMLNKGLHQYRFNSNPLEEAYATAWDLKNTPTPGSPVGLLEYILAKDNTRPAGEVSDREVAATLVQWLGSSVGQNFISECQGKK